MSEIKKVAIGTENFSQSNNYNLSIKNSETIKDFDSNEVDTISLDTADKTALSKLKVEGECEWFIGSIGCSFGGKLEIGKFKFDYDKVNKITDSKGKTIIEYSKNGIVVAQKYESTGRWRIKNSDGKNVILFPDGDYAIEFDSNGHVGGFYLKFDSQGRVDDVTDESGKTLITEWEGNEVIFRNEKGQTMILDRKELTVTLKRSVGDITIYYDEDGTVEKVRKYDTDGSSTLEMNKNGKQVIEHYDKNGNITSRITQSPNSNANRTTEYFDRNGNVSQTIIRKTEIIDGVHVEITETYDRNGRLINTDKDYR